MRKRKYKFTDRNQSRPGIISSLIGAAACLLTAGVLAAAYVQSGQAGKFIAVLGFIALLLSIAGIYYGVLGMKEEDVYRLFPYLGCGVNGLVLAAYMMVYVLGW
ncbi:MAG: hypothetical protein KH452_09495 [Clostridiales bacterium]|nr:hypothetical protein [Clostridiales bacterium]